MSGVVYGVLASLFVSLNSIYVSRVLPVVDHNICLLTFYNHLIASVVFLPLIVVTGELGPIWEKITGPLDADWAQFWSYLLLTGLCGLLISFVTNQQIKHTSPLTHNISGTAKAATQTVMATYFYREAKTAQWWLSNLIVLAASAVYTWIKQREMRQSHQSEQEPKVSTGTKSELKSVSVN